MMGCHPRFNRRFTICLRATLFNITLVHMYTHITRQSDHEADELHRQLQSLIVQTPATDITIEKASGLKWKRGRLTDSLSTPIPSKTNQTPSAKDGPYDKQHNQIEYCHTYFSRCDIGIWFPSARPSTKYVDRFFAH